MFLKIRLRIPSLCCSHLSKTLSHLAAFQRRVAPPTTSNIMKKDALCRGPACRTTCAGMRGGDDGEYEGGHWLVRAVMNKDVLCVELVVNHWQRWQLTDRQIDPRPPRERCLAPAHSSQPHECARTWRAHKDCQKARRRSVRSSSAVCGPRGNGRQHMKHLQPLHHCCSPVTHTKKLHAHAHTYSRYSQPDVILPSSGDGGAEGGLAGRTDGWMDCRGGDRMTG